MKQEDKDLLLKDLCARLPYKVKVNYNGNVCTIQSISSNGDVLLEDEGGIVFPNIEDSLFVDIEEVSPYLFPLSSMTEKQCYELASISSMFQDCWKYIKTPIPLSICNFEQIDWFHKNHLDYRGLIEKGLAIDATNLNIY